MIDDINKYCEDFDPQIVSVDVLVSGGIQKEMESYFDMWYIGLENINEIIKDIEED